MPSGQKTGADQNVLLGITRSHLQPVRENGGGSVLAAAAGRTNVAIGVDLDVDVKTVALWRGRFAQTGPEGLWAIASGRGRKPTYSPQKIKAIVHATLSSKPKGLT